MTAIKENAILKRKISFFMEGNMKNIIQVSGLVKFPITIDPSVWIFDERKLTQELAFHISRDDHSIEKYTKEISTHWDREIMEGARLPSPQKTKVISKKQQLLTGTFYMPLFPFIQNAEPKETAKEIIICTREADYSYSLTSLQDMLLLFCVNGKPLTEDGPVYLYSRHKGLNQIPVKNISAFQIK